MRIFFCKILAIAIISFGQIAAASSINLSIVGVQFAADLTNDTTEEILNNFNIDSTIVAVSVPLASLSNTLAYADTSSLTNKQDVVLFQSYADGVSTLSDDIQSISSFVDIIQSNPLNNAVRYGIIMMGTNKSDPILDVPYQKTQNHPEYQSLLLSHLNNLYPSQFESVDLQGLYSSYSRERNRRTTRRNGSSGDNFLGTSLEPLPYLPVFPLLNRPANTFKEFVSSVAIATIVADTNIFMIDFSQQVIDNSQETAYGELTDYVLGYVPRFVGLELSYPVPEPPAIVYIIGALCLLLVMSWRKIV